MPAFVILLRGVNVSGKNIVKMGALREALENEGFVAPKTYVQSGNIVVNQAKLSASIVLRKSTKALQSLGIDVPIIVRSAKQWAALSDANIFLDHAENKSLYVVFLEKKLSERAKTQGEGDLKTLATKGDRFHLCTQEVFLHLATSAGRTKLANNAIEKKLSQKGTRRNWRTVEKIGAMLDEQ